MDIRDFYNDFVDNYEMLYRNDDNVECFSEAVEVFDKMMLNPTFRTLVGKFSEFRQELITSDREACAFVLSYVSLLSM